MRYVVLGNSRLEVSRLGLDCHSIGIARHEHGWDPFSDDGRVFATRTIHTALDVGINVFDTAPDGGEGRSETLLGQALRGQRDRAVLTARLPADLRADQLDDYVNSCLRRLRTDYLDVLYLPAADIAATRDAMLEAAGRLRNSGTVRRLGLFLTDPTRSHDDLRSRYFDVVQMQCDVTRPGPASDALDIAADQRLGVSVVKPLAAGTLQTIVGALGSDWDTGSRARECCLRYLLRDRRIHQVSVGMRWEHEVVTNSRIFSGLDPVHAANAPAYNLA